MPPAKDTQITMTIRVPKDVADEVDRIADEIKGSRSYAARRLLAAAVKLYQARRRRVPDSLPEI